MVCGYEVGCEVLSEHGVNRSKSVHKLVYKDLKGVKTGWQP